MERCLLDLLDHMAQVAKQLSQDPELIVDLSLILGTQNEQQ